jgi:integrase/recombinase XerD
LSRLRWSQGIWRFGNDPSRALSLKEIGDHLGHRGAYATRTYAKVDLVGLREVSAFDLGGLS